MSACRAQTNIPSGDPSDVASAIIAADNELDLDAVMNLYADSAALLPPGDTVVRGKAAIAERYRAIFATFELRFRTRVVRVWRSGGLAVVEGTVEGQSTLVESGEQRDVDDKYVMVLEADPDGEWKIVRLIWSSNRP